MQRTKDELVTAVSKELTGSLEQRARQAALIAVKALEGVDESYFQQMRKLCEEVDQQFEKQRSRELWLTLGLMRAAYEGEETLKIMLKDPDLTENALSILVYATAGNLNGYGRRNDTDPLEVLKK